MSSSQTTVDQPLVVMAAASTHRQDSLVIVHLVRLVDKKKYKFHILGNVCRMLDKNVNTSHSDCPAFIRLG